MTDNAATVTYFRTTLDPLDLYRIDRIINHGEDFSPDTPAAALATYLVELNPKIRWLTYDDVSLEEHVTRHVRSTAGISRSYGKHVSADLRWDAVVFSSGTHHTIVMELRGFPLFTPPEDDRKIDVSGGLGVYHQSGIAVGADLTLVPWYLSTRTEYQGSDIDYAASLASTGTQDSPVSHIRVVCRSPRLLQHAGDMAPAAHDVAAPDVAGFVPISWDSTAWKKHHMPLPDNMMAGPQVTDDPDKFPAIVSRIEQSDDDNCYFYLKVR